MNNKNNKPYSETALNSEGANELYLMKVVLFGVRILNRNYIISCYRIDGISHSRLDPLKKM